MNNTLAKNADPKTVVVTSLVFLLPFLALISKIGVGLCSFGFLLAALWCSKQSMPLFRRHLSDIRGVLIAFGAYFIFAGLVVLLSGEVTLRGWEKPSRMLIAATALAAMLACRPSRRAFWLGLVAGVVAGACVAVYQRWFEGVDRPGGMMNAITFGDILLCMGLMSLAGVLDFRGRERLIPALGTVAGLVGTVATGTRGGWIAIVFSALLFLKYGHYLRGKFAKSAAALVAVLMIAAYLIPQTGVQQRLHQGVSDVRTYYQGAGAFTNVGVRLELWKGALMLSARHPWTPSSPQQVTRELQQLVAEGQLQPFVLESEHFHNDLLQAVVFNGIPGALLWFMTLLLPFLFFLRVLNRHESAGAGLIAPALAGMLLVLSYFSFGLSEVIFWSVRSAMFYALMLFVLMGFCLNAKETDGR
ncbi:O-antigen ligase family protein [Massilia endophytica]|uniref:O-antigen ligase family protein n=1 Tax=Massilia endophytica TaxID=2899220 RepID=UPI001E356B2D|nr:O-antigen ligase family protein [Massilia endophytica]UGQ45461.1 O-antigen ligase family protein [Massilia endophytica]